MDRFLLDMLLFALVCVCLLNCSEAKSIESIKDDDFDPSSQRLRFLLSNMEGQILTSVVNECKSLCANAPSSAVHVCHCELFEESRTNKRSNSQTIDCNVLCFVGQGGRACNCNYAPFVGK